MGEKGHGLDRNVGQGLVGRGHNIDQRAVMPAMLSALSFFFQVRARTAWPQEPHWRVLGEGACALKVSDAFTGRGPFWIDLGIAPLPDC